MAAIAECSACIAPCRPVAAAPARSSRTVSKAGALSGSSSFFQSAKLSQRVPAASRRGTVMSAATDEIVEKLKTITLLEAAELVKSIEEVFGVSAAAPMGGMVAMPGGGGAAEAAPAVEEKTEFDVVVVEVDAAKRINLIKVVRSLTPLGLKEAKDAVSTLPSVLLAGVPKDKAEEAKKALEEGGAKVEIK
eukprot:jgi/Chlat1/3867/Chrsp26S04159